MTTTFETAQVGDKVFDLNFGWGEIASINPNSKYPISINLTNCYSKTNTYTYDGKNFEGQLTRRLFWDEVIITPPPKPLPKLEVDTKVLVWDFEEDKYKIRGHFSHFNKYGSMFIFANGTTSWSSSSTVGYRNWKLAKE